jgi:molybdopterin-guanine dinucleotide biosynthesis protein A
VRSVAEERTDKMKPRFYVQRDTLTWLVMDRLRPITQKTVAVLSTRKEARDRAKQLNAEEKPDRTADQQQTVDGELR